MAAAGYLCNEEIHRALTADPRPVSPGLRAATVCIHALNRFGSGMWLDECDCFVGGQTFSFPFAWLQPSLWRFVAPDTVTADSTGDVTAPVKYQLSDGGRTADWAMLGSLIWTEPGNSGRRRNFVTWTFLWIGEDDLICGGSGVEAEVFFYQAVGDTSKAHVQPEAIN